MAKTNGRKARNALPWSREALARRDDAKRKRAAAIERFAGEFRRSVRASGKGIRDLARLTGLCPSTVSRAYHGNAAGPLVQAKLRRWMRSQKRGKAARHVKG